MNIQNDTYIHLEDIDNVIYWSNTLGISRQDLNEIILQTGSIRIKDIKEYIWKHPSYNSSIADLWQAVLNKMTFLN